MEDKRVKLTDENISQFSTQHFPATEDLSQSGIFDH